MEMICDCTNYKCKHHPRNHDEGCVPCVKANLEIKHLPVCFFNSVKGAEARKGDSYEDFAQLVLKAEQ